MFVFFKRSVCEGKRMLRAVNRKGVKRCYCSSYRERDPTRRSFSYDSLFLKKEAEREKVTKCGAKPDLNMTDLER